MIQSACVSPRLSVDVTPDVSHGAEPLVPSGLQTIGYQPVGRIDRQVPTLREIGLVLSAFQLFST